MGRFEISGHKVVGGEIKVTGNGAHTYVPRQWLGADLKIVRVSEPDHDTDK